MKHFLLLSLLAISVFQLKSQPREEKMLSAAFKAQDFCRAELKDFEYDAHFTIISAKVYFTGANFKGVEKGFITSSSLKPIEELKNRCIPGSIVIFDEVKVIGPDKQVRMIPGLSLMLY